MRSRRGLVELSAVLLLMLGGTHCMGPLRALVHQHREEATHFDGPRCPMYPSCAAWGDRAMEQAGWLGFLLTVDRLFFRETGRLSEKYVFAPAHMSRDRRYYDPLEDAFGSSRPDLFHDDFRPLSRGAQEWPSEP